MGGIVIRLRGLISIFFVLFILNSCLYKKDNVSNEFSNTSVKKQDEILDKIMSMDLNEKIGQLFIVGFEGNNFYNENNISLIRDLKVGGLIFFKKNITDSKDTVNLINNIKSINAQNGNIPLFLSLDQEGGIVTRLPNEILKFRNANSIGKKNDEQYAYEIAKIMGNIVSSLGFNMNFAPVLDVYTNPNNKVIGSRSFSNNKEIVSKMAISTINGFRENNLISVGKHYPGHGDTDLDSHYDLPILYHDYERVRNVELYPFEQAINNGLDAILVSHLLYKNIDPDNIVTFSKKFLYEILRKELKFRGIVITDDMIMKGLTNTESIPEASVKAIKAGVDILLIGSGYENVIDSIQKIRDAVINGEIDEFEIDRKVYNILRIKKKYKVNDEKLQYINVQEMNDKISNLLNEN